MLWAWVTFFSEASPPSSVVRGGELARQSKRLTVDAAAGASLRKEGSGFTRSDFGEPKLCLVRFFGGADFDVS